MKTVVLILTLGTAIPLAGGAAKQIALRFQVDPTSVSAPSAGPASSTGLGALSITDVTVRDIFHSGEALMATLEGLNGRQFVVHEQDQLQDGVVTSIGTDAVVFADQRPAAADGVRPHELRKALTLR